MLFDIFETFSSKEYLCCKSGRLAVFLLCVLNLSARFSIKMLYNKQELFLMNCYRKLSHLFQTEEGSSVSVYTEESLNTYGHTEEILLVLKICTRFPPGHAWLLPCASRERCPAQEGT